MKVIVYLKNGREVKFEKVQVDDTQLEKLVIYRENGIRVVLGAFRWADITGWGCWEDE